MNGMGDVYVVFQRNIPFSVLLETGTTWEVSLQRGMKSGLLAVVAAPQFRKAGEGRYYILASGRQRDVERMIRCGILVSTGTPERGLVSSMRRAGAVTLTTTPLRTHY